MNFDLRCASVGPNMVMNWPKFVQVGDKLAQVVRMLTPSWPKLGRFRVGSEFWRPQSAPVLAG